MNLGKQKAFIASRDPSHEVAFVTFFSVSPSFHSRTQPNGVTILTPVSVKVSGRKLFQITNDSGHTLLLRISTS